MSWMRRLRRLEQRLLPVLGWLTRPLSPHTRVEEQQQARLLSGLLLGLFVISLGLLLALPLVHYDVSSFSYVVGGLFLLAYLASRLYFHHLITWIIVLTITLLPPVSVMVYPSSYMLLPFMSIGILFAIVLLSPLSAALVIGLNVVALLPLLPHPDLPASTPVILIGYNLAFALMVLSINAVRQRDRAKIEQQARTLADSELRYRLMAENVTDKIVRSSLEGIFLYVSPSSRSLLGYEPEEMVGHSAFEWIHPDDVEAVRQAAVNILRDQTVTMSYRLRRKDGSHIWMETTSRLLVDPHTGAPWEIVSVSRDITGRKMVEDAIRQTHLRLEAAYEIQRSLIQQMPIGIQVFDTQGVCTDCNQAHIDIFGLKTRDQIVGKYNILEDALSRDVGTLAGFERARDGETIQIGEVDFDFSHADPRFTAAAGRRSVSVSFFPLFNERGEVERVVALNEDVTERKQAERERLELEVQRERVQMLQHLISDTSHDLKTPLATLNTSLFLLKKFVSDPERRERYAEVLQAQVKNLAKILEDMDSIARLDREAEAFSFEPLDPNQLIAEIISDHETLASQRNQSLEFIPGEGVPLIQADATKLRRAVANLVTNALNYTPDGGTITACTRAVNGSVMIEVHDTGQGIAPEDLPFIFDRFYRSKNSRDVISTGSGLGLAITRKIVEAHGGEVTVESFPGSGSTFRIVLPVV